MINYIKIENWKSIKKSQLSLPTFCALVGENAAGKTNLIQAIKFIKLLVIGKTIDEFQSKISLIPSELINYTDQNNECKISMSIGDNPSTNYELTIRILLIDKDSINQRLIIGFEKLSKLLSDESEDVIYTRDVNDFKVKGTDKFPLNYEQNKLAMSNYKSEDTDKIRNYFSNVIIPEFTDINNLNAEILTSADPSSANLANIIFDLRHTNDDVYSEFLEIIQKFMPLFKSFIEIPSNVPNPTNDPSKLKFLLVAEEENLKENLSMLSLSAGDIRTLYILATALRVNNGSTLIIEEIENGMHPNRVTKLVDQLNTISRVKKMQIIFTTHSPLVINGMAVSSIILVQKDREKGTDFKILDQTEQISGIKEFLSRGGNISQYLNSK